LSSGGDGLDENLSMEYFQAGIWCGYRSRWDENFDVNAAEELTQKKWVEHWNLKLIDSRGEIPALRPPITAPRSAPGVANSAIS
jgi:hypothetical protein